MGGQSHNWERIGDTYYGHTQDLLIILKLNKNNLYWQTFPEKDKWDYVKNYLNLDVDYEDVIKTINKDKHISRAIKEFPNLRLLNQDFYETLVSYLFSANKNIHGIRKSIKSLRKKHGRRVKYKDKSFYLFPTLDRLSEVTEKELRMTGMGFRAKYLRNAIDRMRSTNIVEEIEDLAEGEARKELLKIKGIGEKIADCILVYGLGHHNITPLDVWGKRIVIEYYNQDHKLKYPEMRNWIKDYFDGHAGWAGQFLYEYIRHNYNKK
jgi:N-glycosylase/DNA lyase